MYDRKLDGEFLAPYKGYQIEKNWELDYKGRRVPHTDRYMVVDRDDDWIGDMYKTLAEAKAFIDTITSKKSVRSNTEVGSYKGITYGMEDDHDQNYYFQTKDRRFVYAPTEEELKAKIDQYLRKGSVNASTSLDDILADPEGRQLVDQIEEAESECRYRGIDFDDETQFWARARKYDIKKLEDRFGYIWASSDVVASNDEIPDVLSSRPFVFILNSVNSTYNDDILETAEKFGAIKVKYGMLDDDGTYFSPDKCSWRFAVPSKKVAQDIFDYAKKSRIPVNQKNITTAKVDWSNAYQIYVDDYSDGQFKMNYHANAPKKGVKGGTGVGGRTVYYLVDYPDTEPIYNLDTGSKYCFDSEEEAQAFIDKDSEYWHNKYPGIRPMSKKIYNVWHA